MEVDCNLKNWPTFSNFALDKIISSAPFSSMIYLVSHEHCAHKEVYILPKSRIILTKHKPNSRDRVPFC